MKPKEIIALRERMNITQTELAVKLGITRAAVAKYERGANQPGPEVIEKLNHLVFSNPLISKEEIEAHLRMQQIEETNKCLIKMFTHLESDQRILVFENIKRLYNQIGTNINSVVPK